MYESPNIDSRIQQGLITIYYYIWGICEFCASYRKSPLSLKVYELYEFSYAEITDPDLLGFMGQQACTQVQYPGTGTLTRESVSPSLGEIGQN